MGWRRFVTRRIDTWYTLCCAESWRRWAGGCLNVRHREFMKERCRVSVRVLDMCRLGADGEEADGDTARGAS